MAQSLIKRLADNLSHFDFAAMEATKAELEYLRDHKDQLATLAKYEGKYEHELMVDQALIEAADTQARIVKVSTTPLRADCLFRTLTVCTEYDAFTWPLLSSEYLNYFAKLRDTYSDPLIYGPTERWVIWSTGTGHKLNRVEAVGKLSALHMTFTDETTALLARDAGVYAADFQVPIMAYRVGKLGTLAKFRKRTHEQAHR